MNLNFPICKVSVVRYNGRDTVYFEIDSVPWLQNLHAGHDESNDRYIEIATVDGNGPNLARLLGWTGEIEITGPFGMARVASGNDIVERVIPLTLCLA